MLKRDHTLSLSTQARAPGFRVELRGTTFRLIASGAWTVAEATKLDIALKRLRVPIPPTPEFTGEMDIAGIAEIDTAGALLLQRTAASWEAGGLRTRYAGATESFRILIEEVHKRGSTERPKIKKTGAAQQLTEDATKTLTGVSAPNPSCIISITPACAPCRSSR
jgi:phospholipid/cholesterol/gamma-HCH transport system permease protein